MIINQMQIEKTKLAKNLLNVAVALMFSTEFLCYTLPGLGIMSFFRISYIIGGISYVLLLISLFFGRQTRFHVLPFFFGAFLIVLTYSSVLIVEDCSYDTLQITFNFVLCILLMAQNFEIEKVMRYIMYISLLVIPGYKIVFAYQWDVLNQANMGAIYAVYVIFAAGVLHFIYYRKELKKICWIIYIPTLVAGIGILMYGNRGAIISAFAMGVILFFNRERNIVIGEKKASRRKLVLFLLCAFLAGYLIYILGEVFACAYSIAEGIFDEMPSFFVKMNKYIGLNDISNGRSELNDIIFRLIGDRPFLGYGIGAFTHYTGYSYPHNFFYQLWFEGGILFTIIPTATVLFALYKLFFSQIEDKEICVALCFVTSLALPRFLLSSDIWADRFFWVMVFFVLWNKKKMKLRI